MEAYSQPGISSVTGIPGVQQNVPPPRTGFDQYGNMVPPQSHISEVPDGVRVAMSPPTTVEAVSQEVVFQQDVPAYPGPADYALPERTVPMSSNERTAMMDDARRVFSSAQQAAWTPICRGTIDQVLMSAEGAHILVISDDGARFCAFIPDRPVIELNIRVELGIRHAEDTGRKVSRDVADIIHIN